MEKYIVSVWIILGIILCIIFGPLWVPVMTIGMLLIWLYYRPKNEKFSDFWKKWGGVYWLASILCIFRFAIMIPVFVFIGLVIDFGVKVMNK